MDFFIIFGVIVLIILAILDLVVGVGNDAVNFLNSAIGSRVASFKRIMIVASIGIFIGALSSAGMMEIAREGIFNPEYFSLNEVLIIFLAVMISDVILLDFFNTLGLPTSTTVSILFELLGAAFIVSCFKVLSNNDPMNFLFNINDVTNNIIIGYLNWSKTIQIISGIFLSIFISFTSGILIMFLSRLLFGYQFRKKMKLVGILWASLAMLSMSYFMIYKGLKSSYDTKKISKQELIQYSKVINPKDSIVLDDLVVIQDNNGIVHKFEKKIEKNGTIKYEIFFGSKNIQEMVTYIKDHFIFIFSFVFVFWFVLFFILENYINFNTNKIVVLFGTFSLAMAFAGNDLVNFIGVPLAGWQSYVMFETANAASGGVLNPNNYQMIGLKFPIQTPYFYLIISGLIMILTLWFSKKARSVTETEVKLGSNEENEEKFKANSFARFFVWFSFKLIKIVKNICPNRFLKLVEKQFKPIDLELKEDQPAFDLIRASVNLTVASLLIALATSYKLPLSTTFVSFMVAMGASLADRAWGRETAVYRVSGVLHVIAGWLLTALIAFLIAGLFALILIFLKLKGLILLLFILVATIFYSSYKHRIHRIANEKRKQDIENMDATTKEIVLQKSAQDFLVSLREIQKSYNLFLNGLISENNQKIKEGIKLYNLVNENFSNIKTNLFKVIKKIKVNEQDAAQLYILSNDIMLDLLNCTQRIMSITENHVRNGHKPLTIAQSESIINIQNEVNQHINQVVSYIDLEKYQDDEDIMSNKNEIFKMIEDELSNQVEGIISKNYGFKNTDLVFNILLETKDIVAITNRVSNLYLRLYQGVRPLSKTSN
jgi:phosphate/sulfate permease